MTDGGRESPLRSPVSGGEFLLQLLQKPNQSTLPIPQPISSTIPVNSLPSLPIDLHHPHHQSHNPGVAPLNSSFPFPPWSSNGHDPHTSWPNSTSTPFPPNFIPPRLSNNPNYITMPNFSPSGINGLDYHQGSHFPGNRPIFSTENLQGSGFSRHQQQSQQQENVLMFGSLKCELGNREGSSNRSSSDLSNQLEAQFGAWKEHEKALESKSYSNSEFLSQNSVNPGRFLQFGHHSNSIDLSKGNQEPREQGREGTTQGRQQHSVYQRFTPPELRRTPPGFQQNPRGLGQEGPVRGVRDLEYNVGRQEGNFEELKQRTYSGERIKRQPPGHRVIQGDMSSRLRLSGQLDHPGPPTRNNLHSIPGSDFEETLANFPNDIAEKGSLSGFTRKEESNKNEANAANGRVGHQEQDSLAEQLMGSLILRNRVGNANGVKIYQNTHDKDLRSDKFRAVQAQAQAPIHRMRSYKRVLECRSDIDRLNAPFLVIYESLIPAEEEKSKQKQLLTLLKKLINKEWPRARLFLYGSCANSFGVSNSDIDVCLLIEDVNISKSEILLKLADILQSDNLQNVQALTRARVPIVKFKDPVTGISCDICINNVLAVVNTKLLGDYAQIDSRLRQLAFIVKHWAKSREVNETYRGTLSSYAYVLMCIHFLQQRKPAILPCLQGMEVTYAETVDNVECAYFDKVERLSDFGTNNKESIAQLVWGFFDYWAYRHDYVNDVISVRTGSTISKRLKDWTRRIGNDRHLICIEDPFQTSHDLGRVVDKYSIKVLREEFERAANIMQYDPDPCKILFEHPVNQVIDPEL